MACAIAVGARVADRWAFLRGRQVRAGIWFGLIAIVANTFSADVGDMGILVGLIDAPPMVAGFFFGPVAGVVAGAIAALERAATPLWGVGAATWGRCSLATFFVGAYAAALGKWVFDGKRPSVVTALVAAAFGEVLHLAINSLFGLNELAVTIEIIVAAVTPMTVGSGLAAGLSAFACAGWGGWRHNFASSLTLAFVMFGVAFGTVIFVSAGNAERQSAEMLDKARRDTAANYDDQIGYMLHCNARALASNLRRAQAIPLAQINEWARFYDVDEINVVDSNGVFVASNDPLVACGRLNLFTVSEELAPYRALLTGESAFVKQKFRASVSDPSHRYKYIGVRLPEGGILQLGYGWDRLAREFGEFFVPMFREARVGREGYFLVSAPDGRVAECSGHSAAAGRALADLGILPEHQALPAREIFPARVMGVWSRCVRCDDVGPWRVYAVLPFVETQGPALLTCLITGLVLFLFCVVFRLVFIRFHRAQEKIDALRAVQEQKRTAELAMARTIQVSALPVSFPSESDFRIFAKMVTAREVGGDFYDFYPLPDQRILFLIADVSGKGVPAALFMMRAKATLRSAVFECGGNLAEAVRQANDNLSDHNDAEMFVTAWIAAYDRTTGEVEYVNAGHNPPLVKRADGSAEWLRARNGLVLAALGGQRYSAHRCRLAPGDSLFLYTDGVTEAMNGAGQQYGEKRLEAALRNSGRDFITEISRQIDDFVDGFEQSDDITMLALDVL